MEINLEEIEPPVPPDGAWGWMVLLGSFICMFCVDGLSFSFGVLISDLQSSFDCSITKISLGSSLIVGFTLISGELPSLKRLVFLFSTTHSLLVDLNFIFHRSNRQCSVEYTQLSSIGSPGFYDLFLLRALLCFRQGRQYLHCPLWFRYW